MASVLYRGPKSLYPSGAPLRGTPPSSHPIPAAAKIPVGKK